MSTKSLLVLCLSGLLAFAGCAGTQSAQQSNGQGQKKSSKDKKKTYAQIIPKSAKSDEGLFTSHWVEDDLYYEIPDSLLDRPMLLISRIAQLPSDFSPYINAGSKAAEQVVRWQRRDDQILLRKVSYNSVAADSLPIHKSVVVNNFEPIIHAFKIETVSPDSQHVVIKVNDLYEKDVPALSGLSNGMRSRFGVRRLDDSRSFIDEVKSFPENLNVRHTMTYSATSPPSDEGTGTLTMQMYQSMILLPEQPMTPRLADPRVGYFSVSQINYGSEAQKADRETFISRWKLVPKDKEAYLNGELVEPVDPIVYYLDPATPDRWRPYFCQGIEDWNRAFEAAGFKNAIQCGDPDDVENFDPEDVRYSTVRYVASTTRNAVGPSVSDPRSGQIIESDIIWYHNHIRSYRNRLMIETGAANPGARSLTLDDDLIGETMRKVISHEVGHAIGLPHNMIASSAYPVDSLRSPSFTSKYGVAATIMDYARQNYIAQPGDGVEQFIRMIGPYDLYSVEYGYRWYPDIEQPKDEKPTLDEFILDHADDKRYRFGGRTDFNPESQTEDLGDDPVRASEYAIANLKRVVPNLIEWTSTGDNTYDDLDEIYGELQYQWNRYMGHVITIIGGVYENRKITSQAGTVYQIVPQKEQERALEFLAQNVFQTPEWMLDQQILRRIEPAGAVDRIRDYQVGLLEDMLQPARLQRLTEAETIDRENAYPLVDYMSDLTASLWSEFNAARPAIDTYRRNLQRGYLEQMEFLMTEEFDFDFSWYFGTNVDVSQSDIRPAVRYTLRNLQEDIDRNISLAANEMTRAHLEDASARIANILDSDQ
ncbi:MAG: zinc-dependent metalloprotease [Bacteroidota bacterium]